MRQFYLVICFLFVLGGAFSQPCTVSGQTKNIPDNGKSYSLTIEANTSQAGAKTLCGVRLSFEHQFVNEMEFILVSPSGKEVVLTTGKSASPKTTNSSWDILFVRPDDSTNPDDFKKPIWKDNTWDQNSMYVGSYYPDDAKGLSHFDGDNLIGTWNLIYSDKVRGGTGVLKGFSLVFCDSPSFCGPCQLSNDFFDKHDLGSYCGGEASLRSISPSIDESLINNGFDYTFMVLGTKNQIVLKGKSLNMGHFGAGSYKIIAIQYRPENESILMGVKNRKNLEALFYGNKSKICGTIARSTNSITILSNPGPTVIEREVYGKTSIVIDGQVVSSDQLIVQQLTDQHGCDSLIHLQVSFKDMMPIFTQDNTYSCENTSINLSVSTSPKFPIQRWFTLDGKINNQSILSSNSIIVDAPGTYSVIFEIEDYLDTVNYNLETEPNTPAITLANEYIVCDSKPLKLKIGSNIGSATVIPTHSATIIDDSLIVRQPDLYTVTVNNGDCDLISHILVQKDPDQDIVSISDAQLSCPGETVDLHPNLQQEYENYIWLYKDKIAGNTKKLTTSKPGYYTFRAFNGKKCGVSGTAWIEDKIDNIDFTIEGPEIINCTNKDKVNRLTADFIGDFAITWTLADGSREIGKDVIIAGDGLYHAEITNGSCTFTAEKSVITDTNIIDYKVPAEVTIPCDATSATVLAEIEFPEEEYNISWKGASTNTPKSTAEVHQPGNISVTVTDKTSQCKNTQTIRVVEESGKPKMIFDNTDPSITCADSIIKTAVSFENFVGYEPVISTDKNIVFDKNEVIAYEPGTITFSLDNGKCTNIHSLTFTDKTKSVAPKIKVNHIGCSGQEGVLEITNSKAYSSIELQNNLDTIPYTDLIRNIKSPVEYNVLYTDKTNGCSGSTIISVKNINDGPEVVYEPVHYLNCNTGSAELKLSGTNIDRIVWYDPENNILAETSKTLTVTEAGKYKFVALNKELCYQENIIEVIDDRSPPTSGLKPLYELPCELRGTNTVISYDTTKIRTVKWYGPRGWQSDQFFPAIKEPGTYRLRIEGINGCTNTESVQFILQDFGEVPDVITPLITCNNPFSKVYLSHYSEIESLHWNDESGQSSQSDTFDVYNPGKISLTIRKTNGCQHSLNEKVDEDRDIVSFDINKPIINCHQLQPNFAVKPDKTNGRFVSYQWYFEKTPVGNESTLEIKYPGDYKVKAWYDNGCVDSLSHTVKLDTIPVTFQVQPDTINCFRSKFQLREDVVINKLKEVRWTGPNGYYSEALRPHFQVPGSYEVEFAGQNGCTGNTVFKIFGDLAPPMVDSVKYPSLGCGGKEVDLTYFSSDTIITQYWHTPSGKILEKPNVNISSKGDYILYLEKSNGCSAIDTILIEKELNPRFELDIKDAGCELQKGNALVLPDLDTFMAIWQDPSTQNELGRGKVSPNLSPGSYLVTVRNPYNNCDSTTSFEIKDISSIMEVSISVDDSLRCKRNSANLISSMYPASESYIYEWKYGMRANILSKDSIATDISEEGQYFLTVQDTVNKCIVKGQYLNTRARSTLRAFELFLTEPACDLNQTGYAAVNSILGAHDMKSLTYSMNEGPYIPRDTFPYLYANQSYSLSVKDQYGCTLDTVIMPMLRGVMKKTTSIKDTTINSGDRINFNDPAFKMRYDSPDAPLSEKYTWILNPDTLTCDFDCTDEIEMQLFQTRTASVILTNSYGCTIKDTFQIFAREGDVLNVPNGIIPASSQPENAHACIYTNKYIESIELYIVFNKYGNVVYKNSHFMPGVSVSELTNCWNGRDQNNNILSQGNYNYYVRYKTVNGTTKERYGNIFLLR